MSLRQDNNVLASLPAGPDVQPSPAQVAFVANNELLPHPDTLDFLESFFTARVRYPIRCRYEGCQQRFENDPKRAAHEQRSHRCQRKGRSEARPCTEILQNIGQFVQHEKMAHQTRIKEWICKLCNTPTPIADFISFTRHLRSLHPETSGEPSSDAIILGAQDLKIKQFCSELLFFRDDPSRKTMTFPSNLTFLQRQIVHTLARQMQLRPSSKNVDASFEVHISRVEYPSTCFAPIYNDTPAKTTSTTKKRQESSARVSRRSYESTASSSRGGRPSKQWPSPYRRLLVRFITIAPFKLDFIEHIIKENGFEVRYVSSLNTTY